MNHSKNMARKLPEFTIGGTKFTVDARIYEFRETEAPWNSMPMTNFWEDDPTVLPFDKFKKNIYEGSTKAGECPDHVEMITVPPLKELDPIGLARHYGMADETFIPNEKRERILSEQLIGLQQNTRKHSKGKGIR